MKPFLVLLSFTLITLIGVWLSSGAWHLRFAANVGMSVMLLFTALGHFVFWKGMSLMLPPFIPFRKIIVWATGVLEIAAAMGLLFPTFRHTTAVWLIIFFILIFPANVYAALQRVDYQRATYTGPGTDYLWLRTGLQFFFIVWVWFFSW